MKLDKLTVLGTFWLLFGAYGFWRAATRLTFPTDPVTRTSVVCIILVNLAAMIGGSGVILRKRWAVLGLELLAWFGAGLMTALLVGGLMITIWASPGGQSVWEGVAAIVATGVALCIGCIVFGLTIHTLDEARRTAQLS